MNRPNGQQCLAKIISVCDGSMKQLYIPVYMNRQDADKWNYRQCPILHLAWFTKPFPGKNNRWSGMTALIKIYLHDGISLGWE